MLWHFGHAEIILDLQGEVDAGKHVQVTVVLQSRKSLRKEE